MLKKQKIVLHGSQQYQYIVIIIYHFHYRVTNKSKTFDPEFFERAFSVNIYFKHANYYIFAILLFVVLVFNIKII